MAEHTTRAREVLARIAASFSFVGLAVGTLFLAASLTPSLLPRHYAVQGLLSGIALAVGYGVGVAFVGLWHYLEIPIPATGVQRISKRVTAAVVAVVVAIFLWRESVWQNSIRQLMEMPPIESAYPFRLALIAVATGVALIAIARGLAAFWRFIDRKVSRFVPRRISRFASAVIVVVCVFLLVNDVVARLALNFADATFLKLDQAVEDGIDQPTYPLACGSPESLIEWDHIGRRGKEFIVAGPKQEEISELLGREAMRPVRVYVGLSGEQPMHERAQLALEELKRVGGFERSVLIVATPTGTGWLDPGAVDTIEFLHGGNTAIVSMQYSYLPSWITILVDPVRSIDAARALFEPIYAYWKTLPKDKRPRLYVHGLSLGSLGSEASADMFMLFEDPIQGGLWSGPPFPSTLWARATRYRNPDSPMWLPTFRDQSLLRFTGQDTEVLRSGKRWGPMRFVYIQHASDPMVFFSPELLYRKPEWLIGRRGPDVSEYLRWYPIVTFLQTAFDLPMATAVPTGYGHNYSPANYIDSWIEVTQPPGWTDDDTVRLKRYFAAKPDNRP